MSKSVEMLEDAKSRVRDAEARALAACEALKSSVGIPMDLTHSTRFPRREKEKERVLVPVGTAEIVPEIVTSVLSQAPRAETFFAPLATKVVRQPAPFVATWSAGVPSGRENARTPGPTGGVNTPARRSVFVDELVGNIDKL
jgi:hypothetical protein